MDCNKNEKKTQHTHSHIKQRQQRETEREIRGKTSSINFTVLTRYLYHFLCVCMCNEHERVAEGYKGVEGWLCFAPVKVGATGGWRCRPGSCFFFVAHPPRNKCLYFYALVVDV